MHYLDESHILIFLIQVFILLVAAKLFGLLCQRRGIPALAGEILAGIILGPTIFGRVLPSLQTAIFPNDPIQATMLETIAWLGVLFLLLATGFEVRISTVWKQSKACLVIGFVGVVVPFLLGCAVFWWLPEKYWGVRADHLTFTLFLSIAASISAISVIARILHDLDILKSDFGLATLSAFIVNDLIGWAAFTLVLGMSTMAEDPSHDIGRDFFEIFLFGTVCLTIGTKIVGSITTRLQKSSLPHPSTTLAFICCLGLICGATTQWIGFHAILGFFLAGIMAGNAREISENTRQIISEMVHAIFVPIFFASIGIKVDFFQNFDYVLIISITAVAIGGKFIGAWIGGRLSGFSKSDSLSVGIAFIPGGAMEIIIGMLALELELIPENVFVAVVFAALSSSIAVGPMLAWSIRRGPIDVRGVLLRESISIELKEASKWEIIEVLCDKVAGTMDDLDSQQLLRAVREREEIMGTGLERGVAVPHARFKELDKPVMAFGLSKNGINWNAPDGLPAHFIFLILTPLREEGTQVHILARIAKAMSDSNLPVDLMNAETEEEVFELLNRNLVLESLVT